MATQNWQTQLDTAVSQSNIGDVRNRLKSALSAGTITQDQFKQMEGYLVGKIPTTTPQQPTIIQQQSTPTTTRQTTTPTPTTTTTTTPTTTPTTTTTTTPTTTRQTTTPTSTATPTTTPTRQTTTPTQQNWQTQLDTAVSQSNIGDVRNRLKSALSAGTITQDQFKQMEGYLVGKAAMTQQQSIRDNNLTALQNLRNQGYTDEQIRNQIIAKTGQGSRELQAFDNLIQTSTPDVTTPVIDRPRDTTTGIDRTLLDLDRRGVTERKVDFLGEQRQSDIDRIWEGFTRSSGVLETNNQALLDLYGLNPDGTINTENETGLAAQIERQRREFEQLKNQSFEQFRSGRYARVSGQIRQALAQRGVDVSQIPQEQLFALSDRLGIEAFNDVYEAKENMINQIQTYNDNALNQLNQLRERGVISQNEFRQNSEALRQATEQQIANINKEYANSIFGITDTFQATEEQQRGQLLNSISQMASGLGLSGSQMSILNNYVGQYTNPTEALEAMIRDLANPNSELRKAVVSNEQAAQLAAQAQAQLEMFKAETGRISAQRAGSSPVSLTAQQSSVAAALGLTSEYDDWFKRNYTSILAKALRGQPFEHDGVSFSEEAARNVVRLKEGGMTLEGGVIGLQGSEPQALIGPQVP